MKGRTEEWWKVKLHGIAVVGFFFGGVAGHFAFEVGTCVSLPPFLPPYLHVCLCFRLSSKQAFLVKRCLPLTLFPPSLPQAFEHGALLVNVCVTTMCALIHTLYVAYHERLSPLSVLESRSDIRLHRHRVGPSPRFHTTPRGRHQRQHWARNSPNSRSQHLVDKSGKPSLPPSLPPTLPRVVSAPPLASTPPLVVGTSGSTGPEIHPTTARIILVIRAVSPPSLLPSLPPSLPSSSLLYLHPYLIR